MFSFIEGRYGYVGVNVIEVNVDRGIEQDTVNVVFMTGDGSKLVHRIPTPRIDEEHIQDIVLLMLEFFNRPMKPVVNDFWLDDAIVTKIKEEGYFKN